MSTFQISHQYQQKLKVEQSPRAFLMDVYILLNKFLSKRPGIFSWNELTNLLDNLDKSSYNNDSSKIKSILPNTGNIEINVCKINKDYIKYINNLKQKINKYNHTISKIEIDIAFKNDEITQKQNDICDLNNKLSTNESNLTNHTSIFFNEINKISDNTADIIKFINLSVVKDDNKYIFLYDLNKVFDFFKEKLYKSKSKQNSFNRPHFEAKINKYLGPIVKDEEGELVIRGYRLKNDFDYQNHSVNNTDIVLNNAKNNISLANINKNNSSSLQLNRYKKILLNNIYYSYKSNLKIQNTIHDLNCSIIELKSKRENLKEYKRSINKLISETYSKLNELKESQSNIDRFDLMKYYNTIDWESINNILYELYDKIYEDIYGHFGDFTNDKLKYDPNSSEILSVHSIYKVYMQWYSANNAGNSCKSRKDLSIYLDDRYGKYYSPGVSSKNKYVYRGLKIVYGVDINSNGIFIVSDDENSIDELDK